MQVRLLLNAPSLQKKPVTIQSNFFSLDVKVEIFSQNVTWADLSDGQNTSGCKGKGVFFTSD